MNCSPIFSLVCGLVLLGGTASAVAQIRVDRNLSVEGSTVNPGPQIHAVPANTPTVTASISPAVPSGPTAAYSADAMGPTVVARNAGYETVFRIPGTIPASASITSVAWKYDVNPKPYGFEAILCWQDQRSCWNVTRNASGSTAFFNGKSAAQPFTLHYRVTGSGPLGPPAQGSMNQIIVTYVLPG